MRSSKAATPIRFIISARIPRMIEPWCARSLPEASKVEAVGEHGETASLARIHDAGLFAGALPNGSRRYQLRARFGETVVELDDPYRFPTGADRLRPCIFWAKAPISGSTTSLARIR